MNDLLQSGLHPDADQLNAFVENALPAHERELTMDHLAFCPDCRAIVSLSLPPALMPALPQPEPARQPSLFGWAFPGWKVVWPVATVFAALVPMVLYLHKASPRAENAGPIQVADSRPPAAPPSVPPVVGSTPSSRTGGATAPQVNPARARKAEAPASPSASVALPAPPRAQSTGAARPAIPGNAPKPLDTTNATLGGTIENELYTQLPLSMSGGPRDPSAFQYLMPGVPEGTPAASSGGVQQGVYGGTGQALNEDYIEGVPVLNTARQGNASAASTAAPIAAAKQTSVQQLAVDTSSNAFSAGATGTSASFSSSFARGVQGRSLVQPIHLPSGLPLLSAATSGVLTLALDNANSLFFSTDGGSHWTPVAAPWKGRAVRVGLNAGPMSAPAMATRGGLQGSGVAIGTAPAAGAAAAHPSPNAAPPSPTATTRSAPRPQDAAAASIPSSTLFGTVTDSAGAAIARATVSLVGPAQQVLRSTITDPAGRYRMDGLAAGSDRVRVLAPGFQQLELPVALLAAQPVVANLTLHVGAATETITVTDAPPRIETVNSAASDASIDALSDDASALSQAKTLKSSKVATFAAPAAAPSAMRAAAPAAQPPTAVPPAAIAPAGLFLIVTDTGERWTSRDGRTWIRTP
jgi:hypothetical protein